MSGEANDSTTTNMISGKIAILAALLTSSLCGHATAQAGPRSLSIEFHANATATIVRPVRIRIDHDRDCVGLGSGERSHNDVSRGLRIGGGLDVAPSALAVL